MKKLLIATIAILLTGCTSTPEQIEAMTWYYEQHQRQKRENQVDLIGGYDRPEQTEHKASDYWQDNYPLQRQ